MRDVVAIALEDMVGGGRLQWCVAMSNGDRHTGVIKPVGEGVYAIETPQPWYFHADQVSALAPRPRAAEES